MADGSKHRPGAPARYAEGSFTTLAGASAGTAMAGAVWSATVTAGVNFTGPGEEVGFYEALGEAGHFHCRGDLTDASYGTRRIQGLMIGPMAGAQRNRGHGKSSTG